MFKLSQLSANFFYKLYIHQIKKQFILHIFFKKKLFNNHEKNIEAHISYLTYEMFKYARRRENEISRLFGVLNIISLKK